jgi:hypothetical protein
MDHETRINAALGKILRNYNFLELNLGLCLRLLANPDDPDASHKYLNRVGLPQVIKRLKKLLDDCEHIQNTSEFQKWMERAEEIRPLRNYYVHATWEYFSLRQDTPLGFRVPPWRNEMIRGSDQGNMKIEDLEADANHIEEVFNEFMTIRKRYGV